MKIDKLYWVHKAVILIAYLVDKYGLPRTLPPKAHDPGPAGGNMHQIKSFSNSFNIIGELLEQLGSETTLLQRLSFVMMVLAPLALTDRMSRWCPRMHVPVALAHQASTNKQQVPSGPPL